MWRNNFLPTQVQREVYYRRRYLKIVCGVISIAVLLQVVSYWGYRYFLFKNSDSANTATAMPYVKDAVKVIDQKRCDIPLSSDLALRAIFSVSENARVVLENKAGEKIFW